VHTCEGKGSQPSVAAFLLKEVRMKNTDKPSESDRLYLKAHLAKARELIPQYARAIVDEVVSLSLDPEKFLETLRREVEARRAS